MDNKTSEGRSADRYHRAAWTTIAQLASRGIDILTGFITIRLTIHYLGAERFGLWMTITAMVSMLQFADLGIGNGLLNKIAEASGHDDKEDIISLISNGIFMLVLVTIFIVSFFLIISSFISWPTVFNAQAPEAILEAGATTAVLVVIFAINMLLGIVTKINLALQRGYINGIYQIIGSLIGLIAVITSIKIKAGLPILVASYMSGPVIALFINGLFLFFHTHSWAKPSTGYFNFAVVRHLISLGVWFLVLQIIISLNSAIPNFVISHILGLDQVAIFAVTMKLSSVAVIVQSAILGPLWPAYAEAKSRGDWEWIKSTLLRSLKLSGVIGSVAAGVIILFGAAIITLWIDKSIAPPQSVLWGLGVWVFLSSLCGPLAMFLTGMGKIKIQALYGILFAFLMLSTNIVFTKLFHLSGAAWAYSVAYNLPYIGMAGFISYRIIVKKTEITFS